MQDRDERLRDRSRWATAIQKLREKGVSERKLCDFRLVSQTDEIVEQVLDGTWEWEIPYVVKIPKKTGGFRECTALPLKSRLLMSVIADIVYEDTEHWIHKQCVSYQKGIAVANTVHRISRYGIRTGYKVDISKYFDSASEEAVFGLLEEISEGSSVDWALQQFYQDRRLQTKEGVVERWRSICQGVAMGPVLANLMLSNIDEIVSNECAVYYRYSDDILILDEDWTRADKALRVLESELSKLGLEINPKKIERLDGNSFIFLGAEIGDYVDISKDNLKYLKRKIKKCCKGKKSGSRAQQRSAVRNIQKMFLAADERGYCAMQYYTKLVTRCNGVAELNQYAEEQIRAVYTGKHNFTTNLHKTPEDTLVNLGWVNLEKFFWASRQNKLLFDSLCKWTSIATVQRKILGEKEVLWEDVVSVDLKQRLVRDSQGWWKQKLTLEQAEKHIGKRLTEVWDLAKHFEGKSPLLTSGPWCKSEDFKLLLWMLSTVAVEDIFWSCKEIILWK